MRIVSYNVNGIRAAIQKGFIEWVNEDGADVICLQEVKAESNQLELEALRNMGYHIYWNSALKKGYSGVAILTKLSVKNVAYGSGNELYDQEGRILRVDFDGFSLMCVYVPSGSSGEERQNFKMQWLNYFHNYVHDLLINHPRLIICGDINICHRPIDIHNPVSNKNSSGFLPEERAWLGGFLESGFIDSFRYIHQDVAHKYSWWSYRANARVKNLGWRIDYHLVSNSMKNDIIYADILPEVKHSDHCPVVLEIR
jgi:exodeoxyribonuclease III